MSGGSEETTEALNQTSKYARPDSKLGIPENEAALLTFHQ
jgi:hypothetical protein